MSSSKLFDQPQVLGDAKNDIESHLNDVPDDDANANEWERWGKNFLSVMVRRYIYLLMVLANSYSA
jgi:hypothetical protein